MKKSVWFEALMLALILIASVVGGVAAGPLRVP
jgi:hypothetical protein